MPGINLTGNYCAKSVMSASSVPKSCIHFYMRWSLSDPKRELPFVRSHGRLNASRHKTKPVPYARRAAPACVHVLTAAGHCGQFRSSMDGIHSLGDREAKRCRGAQRRPSCSQERIPSVFRARDLCSETPIYYDLAHTVVSASVNQVGEP